MIHIDEVIRTKRRSIALIVERDGRLVVRAPIRVKDEKILEFVNQKEKWILNKQEKAKALYPPFAPKEYVNGEGFWYLGKTHPLQWTENQKPLLSLNENFQLSQMAAYKAPIVFEKWYRGQAYKIISERVQWYAEKHGFVYKHIKITSARTRWGSCNSKGTLSFTWRLVMAPMSVIDYVVVYELVHLKAPNHSKEYWSKVRLIMPDYQSRIDWLDRYGHLLRLE
jgi:predicted metal-dependent hydrolase